MEVFSRLLEPIKQKIRTLVGRAVITRVKTTGPVQMVQAVTEGGGAMDGIEYIEPFGLTTSPPKGNQRGFYLKPNADGSQMMIFCIDGRNYRLDISDDEAALYNSQGDHVHIKKTGEIHVKASTKVYAETPLFECSANCLVKGSLTVEGQTTLNQTTTVAAGGFNCAAPAAFSAAIVNMGVDIGATHSHLGGNESDGTTGGVIP